MLPKDRLIAYVRGASRGRLSRLHLALFGSCPLTERRMGVEALRADLLRSVPRLFALDERDLAALIASAEGRRDVVEEADFAEAA